MNKLTHEQVIQALDKAFAPDLTIKLDTDSLIIGCMPITQLGAVFLLRNAIIGKLYDDVNFGECCIESIMPEEGLDND